MYKYLHTPITKYLSFSLVPSVGIGNESINLKI